MPEPPTLAEALCWGRERIDGGEARILLCEAAGCSRTFLAAFAERGLDPDQWERYRELIGRRASGVPVAYLTGRREFYSRVFTVEPGVLIPRPESELLVDAALDMLCGRRELRVLDLGTGSGILAITLALELGAAAASVLAIDESPGALACARANAQALGADVSFRRGDWLEGLGNATFDLIVSNPPYVRDQDEHLQRGDLRFEPRTALAAGPDGLDDLRLIIEGASANLADRGWLLLEHGYDQAEIVRGLLLQTGFHGVESRRDIAGIERVSMGCKCLDGARRRP